METGERGRRARGALRSRERMKRREWMSRRGGGEETRNERAKERRRSAEFSVSFALLLFFASLFVRLDRLRQLFHLRMITYYSTLASL